MTRGLGTLLAAIGLASALPAPATASAAGWTCEASAVRASVLSAPAIEPVTANAGGRDCAAASGGVTAPPGLPLPLALGALDAATALDGATAEVAAQTAHASSRATDLRLQALPGLPIDLPAPPDLSPYAHVQVPGGPEIDLRPAIRSLLAQRQLPTAELLRVQAARAEALAACAGGAPRLTGSSALTGVAVGGQPLEPAGPLTRSIQLIDGRRIDPSDLASLVPGVPAALLQPVLDQLPAIVVPATVARIRLTPGERVQSGVRLTQRALHAQVTIAGQSLADIVLGEATVGSEGVGCGGVADLALQCTARRIVLIDVAIAGRRVRLHGAADRRFAGRRVRIRSAWDGRTVARPRLDRSGLFHATAKLPPRRLRATNDARYRASIGRERSFDLKLVRRMVVTRTSRRGGTVRITGRVLRPLAKPLRSIEVRQRVSCNRWKVVKRFRPRPDGRFSVRLEAPGDGQAAAYRMSTKVPKYSRVPRLYPTFTLPRYVDLG